MPRGVKNLPSSLSVVTFKIVVGTPTLSSDFQSINIPYVGTANPARSSVSLSTYEYSLDGGTTWDTMTASSATSVSGLSFGTSGTSLNFEWEARADIGGSIYNTAIMFRFIATEGGVSTLPATKSVSFTRQTVDQAAENESPFPESYKGTPGYRLMSQAPRANTR